MKLFNLLSYNDKLAIQDALKEDKAKFSINQDFLTIHHEKGLIIIEDLRNIYGKANITNLVGSKNILQDFASFPSKELFSFLKDEKQPNEDFLDCLKRSASKLNWYSSDESIYTINDFNIKSISLEEGSNRSFAVQINNSKIYLIKDLELLLKNISDFDFNKLLKEISPKSFEVISSLIKNLDR